MVPADNQDFDFLLFFFFKILDFLIMWQYASAQVLGQAPANIILWQIPLSSGKLKFCSIFIIRLFFPKPNWNKWPVLRHSTASYHLLCWHPICVLFHVPVAPVSIPFLANGLTEDSQGAWASSTHAGDPHEAFDSWLQLGIAMATVAFGKWTSRWKRSLYLLFLSMSLHLSVF